jgi:hypothetical protein
MGTRNQRGGKLIDRVRHQNELRALEQAKRVTWKCLAATADEYTDWQVFELWLRAVGDAAGNVPPMVARQLEAKAPRLLDRIGPELDVALKNGGRPGTALWQHVSLWAEKNIFFRAARGGWLDAVRYYSSMSLRSMQAWSHWERVENRWRHATPKRLPSYRQWQREVSAVSRLSNPASTAQRVLESFRELSEAKWGQILSRFTDLMVFSLWLELVLDIGGPTAEIASVALAERHPGFNFSNRRQGSKDVVRDLATWAFKHELALAGKKQILAALSFHVNHHPAYPAMRRYAVHCHDVWTGECPNVLPSFVEWRQAADEYTER